jgi:two-component system nitrate/nitrite response regulator NarL
MSSEPAVPTYIIASDGLLREGLRLILSNTRFSPNACAVELDDLTEVPSDRPVLFIIGAGADQAVICSKIRSQYPVAYVVAVADDSNPHVLSCALDAGASAALFSSVSPNALVSTLQAVTNGKLILIDSRLWSLELQHKAEERASPPLQSEIPRGDADEAPATNKLSAREIEILQRIVRGDSNKHVARFFKIAEPTVKAHVKAIFRKIGAGNRTQAAIWALNHRLFDDAAPHDLPELLQNVTGRDGAPDPV